MMEAMKTYEFGSLSAIAYRAAGMFLKKSTVKHKYAEGGLFTVRLTGSGGMIRYY